MGITATKKTAYKAIKRKKPLSKKTLENRGIHPLQVEYFTTYVEIDGRHIIIKTHSNIHARRHKIIKSSFNKKEMANQYFNAVFDAANTNNMDVHIYDNTCFSIRHDSMSVITNILSSVYNNK